jgi:GDP-4-dehydro-6-deoxy-D-mannose reductase
VTKVLVTGANGFIGRRLVKSLSSLGVEAVPVGRDQGDLANGQAWDRLPRTDVVVHLAGRSFVPDSWRECAEFLRTNVVSTAQALEYCCRTSARLIYVSAYVYGIPRSLPISEDHPANPNNPYALSKRMGEEACEFYSSYRGVSATVLRLFNVYGPEQRPEFLIPEIIQQVRKGERILVKDLKPRRDYVYVDDVVDALVRTLRASSKGFNVFNVGSGESLSVAEIVDCIQRAAGTSLPVECGSVARPQEIPDVRADITRARSVLGWKPRHSFNMGIQSILSME